MIISDILESQSVKRNKNGFSVDRDFIVDEVGGNPTQKLYNAMTMGGIPQYGDPHPFIPEVQVTLVSASPIKSGEQVRVKVSYTVPSSDELAEIEADEEAGTGTLTLSSNTTSETVFRDINGELLKASYGVVVAGGTTVNIASRYAEADVERPQLRAEFTRTENTVPKASINLYLGKVNSVPWSGYPAKTWICSKIAARENKGKFDVDYGFSYRPESWLLEVVVGLTQEEAENLPIDVNSGNGYARFDVYRTADFNNLGVSF